MNGLATKLVDSPLTSVDDIFTHLTIPEIQKLRKEYKENIDTSKQDLFTLVGNKYRDLIKIAEDIDDMYTVTNDIDSDLTDLSYKPLKFVNFNNSSPQIKYNSTTRKNDALGSIERTKITVLRDLIYNKLIKLDLKIENCTVEGKESPLYHTSNFIYYAKVYYTIEIVFKDTLKNNKVLQEKFTSLKDNFLGFIENELTTFNLFNNSYQTNDKFKLNQKFRLRDLFLETTLYNEEEEEEDGNDLDEDDNTYESEDFSVSEPYNKHSPPIVNYLLTYIILNHSTSLNTSARIANKFLELRHEYLSKLLNQLNGKNVNFFGVFKYIENTAAYIQSYFKTPQNELLKNLQLFTKPWIALNIIGFKSWFKTDKIPFNQNVYLLGLHESALTDIAEYLEGVIGLVFQFVQTLLMKEVDLSNTLVIYYNFMLPLKTVSSFLEQCNLISLILKVDFDELLSLLSLQIRLVFKTHFEQLSSVLIKIVATHSTKPEYKNVKKLFTKDICSLMDSDVDQYINVLGQVSLNASNESSIESISTWFNNYNQYKELLLLEEIPYAKLTPETSLSHLCKSVSAWEFKSGNTEEIIETLHSEINTDYKIHIDTFTTKISELVKTSKNRKAYFYFLEILLFLNEKLASSNVQDSKDRIENLIGTVYTYLIEEVGNEYEAKLIVHTEELLQTSVKQNEVGEATLEVSRPTIRLSSLMYQFSRELSGINGKLLINSSFVELKNKWIQDVVDKISQLEAKEDPNGEAHNETEIIVKELNGNGNVADEKTERMHAEIAEATAIGNGIIHGHLSNKIQEQLFANTSYLLQFIQKHAEASKSIDDITSKRISQSVADFYKSNKNIYFPLLS